MRERKEGDPYFSWRDYVFGYNIGAATLQILIGFGVFGATYFIFRMLFG